MYQLSKKGTPNSWLNRLWQFLSGRAISKQESLQGLRSKVTTNKQFILNPNDFFPCPENIVRGGALAQDLIEIYHHCYEARHALSFAARDCFASNDGDDIGWTIADTLDDNTTPIDPNIKSVLLDLIQRRNQGRFVLGGGFLKQAVRLALGYADAFVEIGIEKDGLGSYGIAKSQYLPTWEIFKIVDDYGNISHYEQRSRLNDPDPIKFLPINVVHFSYERQNIYGQSLFMQSRPYWQKYKDAILHLAVAARDTVVSPYIHKFPEYYPNEAKDAYISDIYAQAEDGIISNFFVDYGFDLQKLQGNDSLSPLIKYLSECRYRMIPAGFPVWSFPGMDTSGAKDISGQPALTYARLRNDWCSMVSEGIRWMCDIEICLKLGFDYFLEKGQYRVAFPRWSVVSPTSIADENAGETNKLGVEDVDP